jgi:hypothetical protein
MKTYKQRKEEAREEAIAWQLEAGVIFCSWQYIAEKTSYFYKLAKRYGLIKEFKENGII